ncbi:MAG TPA: hypothetical protein PKM73_06815 [Verrucomicrobiota bacterium]|nr:hypothetical protein [Verrucomicrobiota bacterium]HNU50913.1 hypothetical protein [Verrucomicrobiota bacterium]
MKSAYELAMERLNKTAPVKKLTAKQKQEIAEVDTLYRAKIAEHDLGLKRGISDAEHAGNEEEAEKLRTAWASGRRKLEAELEAKKEAIRGRR